MQFEKYVSGWEEKIRMYFKELLFQAKTGCESAIEQILEIYQPLLIKNSLVDGIFDEELYQELVVEVLKCIRHFQKIDNL